MQLSKKNGKALAKSVNFTGKDMNFSTKEWEELEDILRRLKQRDAGSGGHWPDAQQR